MKLSKAIGEKLVALKINSSFSGMIDASKLLSGETGLNVTFVGSAKEDDLTQAWCIKTNDGTRHEITFA